MCGSPEKAFEISNKLTHVVLTNGGSDATFIARGQPSKSVPIPPVSSLKSAIGAGDCVGEFLRGAKQQAFDSVCTVFQCTWPTLLHGRLCILYRFLTYKHSFRIASLVVSFVAAAGLAFGIEKGMTVEDAFTLGLRLGAASCQVPSSSGYDEEYFNALITPT